MSMTLNVSCFGVGGVMSIVRVKTLWASAAIAGLIMSAGTAAAAVVTFNSVSGAWIDSTPSDVYGLNVETTSDYSRISWGDPDNGVDQSSFQMDWTIPPSVDVDTDTGGQFELGVFTHSNHWLLPSPPGSPAITSAELQVDVEILIGATSHFISQVFEFAFDETPNEPVGSCAYGGTSGSGVNVSGCADYVSFLTTAEATRSAIVDGIEYTIDIYGFMVGDQLASFFLTEELRANEALLVGQLVAYRVPEVPLPAAGWLLVAGIGGLGALSRLRRAA